MTDLSPPATCLHSGYSFSPVVPIRGEGGAAALGADQVTGLQPLPALPFCCTPLHHPAGVPTGMEGGGRAAK